MLKSTEKLLHNLCTCGNIENFLDENFGELLYDAPQEFLAELLREKSLKIADVARLSGQGEYVYKALQGKRRASRDILVSIAIGMQLTIPQTQHLLRLSQTARLDPRHRRDSILLYSLNRQLPVEKINLLLFDFEEKTL